MAIPPSAVRFQAQIDPGDRVEFVAKFDEILQVTAGEQIADGTWTLTMSAEGAAVGVQIGSVGAYAPALQVSNQQIRFWLSVADANQSDAIFNTGVEVAITIRFETTNSPPRRYERSFVVRVVNQ